MLVWKRGKRERNEVADRMVWEDSTGCFRVVRSKIFLGGGILPTVFYVLRVAPHHTLVAKSRTKTAAMKKAELAARGLARCQATITQQQGWLTRGRRKGQKRISLPRRLRGAL